MSVLMRTYSLKPSIIEHKIMYMYKKKSRHFENLSGIIITKIKKKNFLFIMWKQGILYTTYDEFRLNEFVV